MNIAIYWARANGAHPNASIELTEEAWLVMHRRVRALGYELTLLTAKGENVSLPHEYRIDFDVDPSLPILSREIAWSAYLQTLAADEQAAMVEPDAYLRKRIPPLAEDKDLLLLERDRPPTPSCFRLSRPAGATWYSAMRNLILMMPREKQRWWGDIDAQQSLLDKCTGLRIEYRDSRDYCMPPWKASADPVAWYFNGTKKRRMLTLP